VDRHWSLRKTGARVTPLPESRNSPMTMTVRRTILIAIAALAATTLCGCASEDAAGRFLVTPDKFVLYNCVQLSDAAQANFARQQQLEKLMTKAGTGSGAEIVSDLAYRPEYVQLRGEMNELRKATAEKKCKPLINTNSPTSRTSDQAVR
jgi:hypothetical protein